MKIKFNSDDNLPLKETLELGNIIIVVISVKGINYGIYFWYMFRDETIDIMKNFDSEEKSGFL